jgi:hypothetical protein
MANLNRQQSILEKAFIAHFQFKSEDDFVRRARRGGFPDQQNWETAYNNGNYRSILDGHNALEEKYLANYWRLYLASADEPKIT